MSVVKINPAVFNDKRDAVATAWNEGLRLWMDDNSFDPQFEFTPEQQTFFAKTAYSQDAAAMRKTIVARIATRDTSVPNPTPEQIGETARLLQEVAESIGKYHKDAGVVRRLAEDLQTRAPAPEQAAEAPVTEGTEQMAQGAGDTIPPPPEDRPTLWPRPKESIMTGYAAADVAARKAAALLVPDAAPDEAEAIRRQLIEVAATESTLGTDRKTDRADGAKGMFQITEETFKLQMGRIKRDPALTARLKEVGLDPKKMKYDDVLAPEKAALVAGLVFRRDSSPIPKDEAGRAKHWKTNYNTVKLGKGSVDDYMEKMAEVVTPAEAWHRYESSRK